MTAVPNSIRADASKTPSKDRSNAATKESSKIAAENKGGKRPEAVRLEPTPNLDGSYDVDRSEIRTASEIKVGKTAIETGHIHAKDGATGRMVQGTIILKAMSQDKLIGFFDETSYIQALVDNVIPDAARVSPLAVDLKSSSSDKVHLYPVKNPKMLLHSPSPYLVRALGEDGKLHWRQENTEPVVHVLAPDGDRFYDQNVFERVGSIWAWLQPNTRLQFGQARRGMFIPDTTRLNPLTGQPFWTLKQWLQRRRFRPPPAEDAGVSEATAGK